MEDKALQEWVRLYSAKAAPTNWRRFIDDILGLFFGRKEDLEEFKLFMNAQDPNIDFTMEFDLGTRSVNYLDITITINDMGYIKTDLFTKPNLKN